jgi:hypothetical protein
MEKTMEPISTSGTTFAKILSGIKDLPLWLLSAVALTLIIFLYVPALSGDVPKDARPWIVFIGLLFTVLAGCRFVSVLIAYYRAHRAAMESHRTFYLTPIAHECRWGGMEQRDGSMTTQISGRFMAKNRTEQPLYPLKVRLIRPKIGELMQELLLIQSTKGNLYGTAQVSGNYIPPRMILPVAITLIFKGLPRRKTGEMGATLAFTDEEGNEQRVKVRLKPFNSAEPVGKVQQPVPPS